MIDAGLIAARFVHYVALALAFGALAYGYYGRREILPGVARAMSRLAVVGSVGVLFGAHVVLAATVAGLGGGLDSLADGAALYGADLGASGIYEEGLGEDRLSQQEAAVRAAVRDYLARAGAARNYPGIDVGVRIDAVSRS